MHHRLMVQLSATDTCPTPQGHCSPQYQFVTLHGLTTSFTMRTSRTCHWRGPCSGPSTPNVGLIILGLIFANETFTKEKLVKKSIHACNTRRAWRITPSFASFKRHVVRVSSRMRHGQPSSTSLLKHHDKERRFILRCNE